MKKTFYLICLILIIVMIGNCTLQNNTPDSETNATESAWSTLSKSGILFDDFDYSGPTDSSLTGFGWQVRSGSGGPGVTGCSWDSSNISFIADPSDSSNTLMRLISTTSGTGATTSQAEINHQRKYLEGTYAARIRFTDTPFDGTTDGDEIVETFFTITPLTRDLDPDYSEIDFEYLANGGWGTTDHSLWNTTWETYQPDPWEMDADSFNVVASHEGWQTLVFTVADGKVSYYVNGTLRVVHSDKYYPETPMSINFNLWFINGGLVDSLTTRSYVEDIDWVFFSGKKVLTTAEVEDAVANYRNDDVSSIDTVQ